MVQRLRFSINVHFFYRFFITMVCGIFNLRNIEHWKILLKWSQKRNMSHELHFSCAMTNCTITRVCHWIHWIMVAAVTAKVFRAQFKAFFTIVAVFFWNPTVHCSDCTYGSQEWWWSGSRRCWSVKVEGGEGCHVRPPHWHHSLPSRSRRRGGKDLERAWRTFQRKTDGGGCLTEAVPQPFNQP